MNYIHEKSNKLIRISKPWIEIKKEIAKLVSKIEIAGEINLVWFSVPKHYSQFLCEECSDAFVIGLLPVAMRQGLDIICEAPLDERLLFQIQNILLPLLSKYGKNVYKINIYSPIVKQSIQNAYGVGAGISCGVDSLHIVKNHSMNEYPNLKLTHLVLNNVGAFGKTGESNQYNWTIDLARKFCNEYGFELILTNSNIFDVVKVDFEQNHTYLNTFAIYCLKKLWKIFYYGSWGIDIQKGFTLIDNELHDCGAYDVLLLDVFSTENLKIYSEGAAYSRYEKTSHIVNFEPAQKYLQVCVSGTGKNCGHCFKCKRTLLTLDALGALDKFTQVFDILYYKHNRNKYLRYLYKAHNFYYDKMLSEVYETLKNDISISCRILGFYDHIIYKLKLLLHPLFEKIGLLKKK